MPPRSASQCGVLVPLRCFPDEEVEDLFSEQCAATVGCAVRGSARRLGVQPGPGAGQRQWTGVAARILRRAGEIVNAGEALGARIVQCRVYSESLALFREPFCAPGGLLLDTHGQAAQRIFAAP